MGIKNFFEKSKDYAKENPVKLVIIGGSLLIIILLIILLILVSVNGKKNKIQPETEIILTEPQIIPNGPEVQQDYVISRTAKDKWSEEEVDDWFTVPTLKDVENLGKSNDKTITDILGNAP